MKRKEFFENQQVIVLALEMQSCMKVCHHKHISKTDEIIKYLWKDKQEETIREFVIGSPRNYMQRVADWCKELNEKFEIYFTVMYRW